MQGSGSNEIERLQGLLKHVEASAAKATFFAASKFVKGLIINMNRTSIALT